MGHVIGGYGRLMFKRHRILAHRAAWVCAKGRIPKGRDVLHKCDVPACINVDHLFLGTHQDNMTDCVVKGRRTVVRGMQQGNAKLTDQKVRTIRADRRTQKLLAARYGVSQALISLVKRRQAWRHI